MICGESCRLDGGRRPSTILANGWIQRGLIGLILEGPFNQRQRGARTGASTLLTSSSVALCPISRSIHLLSPSSTAERSCLLSTSVIERDVFVKLLEDVDLDPIVDADSGDCAGVRVAFDHPESIVS